jgi:hypothetical protein
MVGAAVGVAGNVGGGRMTISAVGVGVWTGGTGVTNRSTDKVGVAVGCAVALGDAVCVKVAVGVKVAVSVEVAVGVAVSCAVALGDAVCVKVAVGVKVAVNVEVAVAVGVVVGCAVELGDAVCVKVAVGVKVAVSVEVAVGVAVGCAVELGDAVCVKVAVNVEVAVAVGVVVGCAVALGDAVCVKVAVGVKVAVNVEVAVAVGVVVGCAVALGDAVCVKVAVGVKVAVNVEVAVAVGVAVGLGCSATAVGLGVSVSASGSVGTTVGVIGMPGVRLQASAAQHSALRASAKALRAAHSNILRRALRIRVFNDDLRLNLRQELLIESQALCANAPTCRRDERTIPLMSALQWKTCHQLARGDVDRLRANASEREQRLDDVAGADLIQRLSVHQQARFKACVGHDSAHLIFKRHIVFEFIVMAANRLCYALYERRRIAFAQQEVRGSLCAAQAVIFVIYCVMIHVVEERGKVADCTRIRRNAFAIGERADVLLDVQAVLPTIFGAEFGFVRLFGRSGATQIAAHEISGAL